MRNAFLYYLMSQLNLVLVQFLAGLLLLPPTISPHLLLWLLGIVNPLISATMMANTLDLQIIKMAQGKNSKHVTCNVSQKTVIK